MNQPQDESLLLSHDYDGIQEYDNPLPGWWTNIFWLTIVFSVVYLLFFHTGAPGRSMIEQYDASGVALAKKQFGQLGELQQDRATLARFMKDEKWVKYGESTFKTHCQSCHGADAGGLVGPNLCDDRWKNVKHLEDIITIINNGAGGNAMPAWKQKLGDPREVIMVAAYVASRLGAKPSSPRPPEGAVTISSWEEDLKSLPPGAADPAAAAGK
jgi:cytochrome c oxidase cbb3-type subunit 3